MNQERFWKKKIFITYILSIMVVLLHLSTFANYAGGISQKINYTFSILFQETIVRAAVPSFFVISGALFYRNYSNDKYKEKLKSRLFSLAIPYLIWNFVWMLFNIAVSYSFLSAFFIGREKYVISLKNILLGIFHYQGLPALWFVFDLMFFVVISPIINYIVCNKQIGIITIITLMILAQIGITLPESIFFDGTAIIYYIAGGIIGKHYFEWFSRTSTKREIYESVLVCLFGVIYLYGAYCNWYPYPVICKVIVLLFLAFSLWRGLDVFVDRIKNIDYMKESFMIYVLHGNLNSIVTKLLFLLLPRMACFAIPNYVFSAIIVLIIIRLTCWILKKYALPVYRMVSGSR
jgi:surface polysaccharide O-acyltransferase-like enzyme